nr:hypothetical protein [Tanacetum cinerariifolium]
LNGRIAAEDRFGVAQAFRGQHADGAVFHVADQLDQRPAEHAAFVGLAADQQRQHAEQVSVVGHGRVSREVTGVRRALEHLGHGELPTQQRADARQHHEAHHQIADHGIEHLGKHQTERRGGRHQFCVADDACDDVGRNDVDHRRTEGAAEDRDR